ncbi:MAG TPA: 30S ribosomal protein S6 [Solirubrobacteraceae bacterium]|nr:30S ribosomal protein S6 [Solirubrobacteraceae bacterium]
MPAPTYDLVLLLDPQAEEAARAKIVSDTRTSIGADGELLRHDEWGERALTYPIDRRASARYHLLQFHAANAELLSGLDRTLRLADEVLRFRIIKLAPGVGAPPDMGAAPAPAREGAGDPAAAAAEPAPAVAAEPAPAAAAEPAPTPEPAPEGEGEAATEPAPEAEVAEQTPAAPAEGDPAAEVAVGEPSS